MDENPQIQVQSPNARFSDARINTQKTNFHSRRFEALLNLVVVITRSKTVQRKSLILIVVEWKNQGNCELLTRVHYSLILSGSEPEWVDFRAHEKGLREIHSKITHIFIV